MTLPMSWDEWARHDGVTLGSLVSKGEVTAAELASQAAAGVAKVDTEISAVVEVFLDAVENPEQAGANLAGALAGVPFLMKDLSPTMKGRLQEMGSLLMRGNRADADTFLTRKMRQAGLNLIGRTVIRPAKFERRLTVLERNSVGDTDRHIVTSDDWRRMDL